MENVSTVEERKTGHKNWTTIVTVVAFHIGAVWALFEFSWSNLLAASIMWWITGSLGIGLGFHRLLTHRSFQVPKWLERTLAVCGSMALQGSPNDWVATHRIHHAFCETEKDPHSPRHGTYWSHIGWITVGTSQMNPDAVERRFIPDLLKDKFLVALSKHFYVPIILAGAVYFLIGGWSMVLWAIFFTVTVGWHFTWLVNSATHIWGKRRFETHDDSTNNGLVAAVTFGEGWHNNHHAHPTSARHGLAWYEFDLNYIQIRFLEIVGLAKKVRVFDLKEHESRQTLEPSV